MESRLDQIGSPRIVEARNKTVHPPWQVTEPQ